MASSKAYLLLEDGTFFEGKSVGAKGTSVGELCFNTGMTGYQEVFTDPSYFGQTIIMTNSHIGNYGVTSKEEESDKPKISGLICKTFADDFSRGLAEESLGTYLQKNNVVGISDVDTRALVRHVRDKGAMNVIISSLTNEIHDLKESLKKAPGMKGLELSSKVSTPAEYEIGAGGKYKVAVLDLGVKRNILQCMAERNFHLKVFPSKATFEELNAFNPDGFFLSNGPGDPAATEYAIKTTKQLMTLGKPIFGICLGHQILALANGISTFKMHHGHRGLNHPVINLEKGTSEITSQNHGFSVNRSDIEQSKEVEITHVNLNDDTVEGIRLKNYPAFSVQYHPEAAPGPHDSRYLFDQFAESMT